MFSPFASYPAFAINLAIVLFVLWMPVVFIVSRLGWKQLAADFRNYSNVMGGEIRNVSCKVGKVRFWKLVRVKYNEKGIYFRLPYLFSIMCPPLFLPWSEIEVKGEAGRISGKVVHLKVKEQSVFLPLAVYEMARKV